MTEKPARWWLGRTSALITVAITLPFLVLGMFLGRHIIATETHLQEQEASLIVFQQGLSLLPDLHLMQAVGAARVHIPDGVSVEYYEEASNRVDQGLPVLLDSLQTLQSDRINEQATQLALTWQDLKVAPGWDIENATGPLDNIDLPVRALYQLFETVLYSYPTQTSADLRIHDLLRPILGPVKRLRREIALITAISVYSAQRDGYLNSIDADLLDESWQLVDERLAVLAGQIEQLSQKALPDSQRITLGNELDGIDLFLERINEEIILSSIIDLSLSDALAIGDVAQQHMQSVSQSLLEQAIRINREQQQSSIVEAAFFSLLLLTGYLALLGFSLMVYRSNFVALQAREESVAKSNFLARMGHEIRTPMNGVLGLAELLRDTQPSPRQKEYIELIESAGRSLVTLINDILDYAKIEAGKMELESVSFDPRNLVYESTHMFSLRADENSTLILADVAADVPSSLHGDATRLRQILINLISNAVKFTQQGHIRVSVKLADSTTEEEGAVRLRFEIRDTGIGIPEEGRDRIFSVFSQASSDVSRRFGGTGLGLAICREIVHLMQGEIGIAANAPRGTCFWFEIPVAVEGQASPVQDPDIQPAQAGLVDPAGQLSPFLSTRAQFDQVVVFDSADALIEHLQRRAAPTLSLLVINGLDPSIDVAGLSQQAKALQPDLHVRLVSGVRESAVSSEDAACVDSWVHRSVFTLTHLARLFDQRADSIDLTQTREQPAINTLLPPGIRALIAEDNPVNQMVTQGFLKRIGASDIQIAENGRVAVDLFMKNEGFDLILMDLDMPEMDGFEATRVIRQREAQRQWPRSVILALSAHALPQYGRMVLDAGMDGQLIKPVTLNTLYSVINQHFRSQQG